MTPKIQHDVYCALRELTDKENQPLSRIPQNIDTIIKILEWSLEFIIIFNKSFRTKDGEYKYSIARILAGAGRSLFIIGLKLIKK